MATSIQYPIKTADGYETQRMSHFKVIQHYYGGSQNGYTEALEIKNPPLGRAPFMAIAYCNDYLFAEFSTLEAAIDASKAYASYATMGLRIEKRWREIPELTGSIIYTKNPTFFKPWPYAKSGNAPISGMFCLPEGTITDHEKYKAGEEFLVIVLTGEERGISAQKCIGVFEEKALWESGRFSDFSGGTGYYQIPFSHEVWNKPTTITHWRRLLSGETDVVLCLDFPALTIAISPGSTFKQDFAIKFLNLEIRVHEEYKASCKYHKGCLTHFDKLPKDILLSGEGSCLPRLLPEIFT